MTYTGPRNPFWKGGRTIASNGYVLIRVGKSHHLADVARQCVAAGVPCFVKQDYAFKPGQQGRIPADIWALKQFPTPAATVASRTR